MKGRFTRTVDGGTTAARRGDVPRGREYTGMMTVHVNGLAHEIDAGTTLGGLIARLGVRRDGVAVARNDDVVMRSAIDATPLCEGDAIEIIAAVAGG